MAIFIANANMLLQVAKLMLSFTHFYSSGLMVYLWTSFHLISYCKIKIIIILEGENQRATHMHYLTKGAADEPLALALLLASACSPRSALSSASASKV